MAWALPADAQAGDGPADALARRLDGMDFLQVTLEQRGRPDGGTVAIVARIRVHDRVDQRIDDPQSGRGPTAAWGIEQAVRQGQVGSVGKRLDPVVDGLTAHTQEVCNLGEGPTLLKPQQSLGASELRGVMGLIQEALQLAAFPGAELEWSHKPPPWLGSSKAHS
jgi:hypothetical protein